MIRTGEARPVNRHSIDAKLMGPIFRALSHFNLLDDIMHQFHKSGHLLRVMIQYAQFMNSMS
jgi:hypothetical protein